MAIDRLYYYTLSILALGFCCATNYHTWPEKGYLPHKNVGNRFRKDPEEVKREERREAKKKEEKRNKKRQRKQQFQEAEEKRRKAKRGGEEEPEWIADFSRNRKRGEGPNNGQGNPLFTHAPRTRPGRPRNVSFEDEQRPDVATQRSGPATNGSVPYDYVYGQGAVRSNGGIRPSGVRSPPDTQSPSSSNKQSVGSPPSTSNRSKHATVQSHSDTVSPVPHRTGYLTPGSRPFSGDAAPL
jgi:hypothetical protein